MSWDQLLVYLIVAGAAVFLVRGFFIKKKRGCGDCGSNCGPADAKKQDGSDPTASPLVQLEIPARKPDHTQRDR